MRRKLKVIQISGIRGIITAIFIVSCLAAGFIGFPGFVAMNIWNHSVNTLPHINIYQGILLWAIVYLIYFIMTRQSFAVSFGLPKELNEEEMKMLMERVKMQSRARAVNKMIFKNLDEIKKEDIITKKEPSDHETFNK